MRIARLHALLMEKKKTRVFYGKQSKVDNIIRGFIAFALSSIISSTCGRLLLKNIFHVSLVILGRLFQQRNIWTVI